MKVATWNVHRGRGTLAPFRPERITEVLAEIRADLVALQEAGHWLRPRRAMLDAAAIERATGLVPLPVIEGEQGWRSNVILVPRGARVLGPARGLRLGGWEPRGAVLAELDLGQGPFRLIAAHLSLGASRRRLQAAAMLDALTAGDPPTLAMGDLNEWRVGGSALGVLGAAFAIPPGVPTFPAFRPRLPLDWVLGRPAGIVSDIAAHDTPAARRASDHLPLTARVTLPC